MQLIHVETFLKTVGKKVTFVYIYGNAIWSLRLNSLTLKEKHRAVLIL